MTLVARARELRKSGTPAEHKVWEWVRGKRLEGLKFRRQHPLGRFILDFYCMELKLGLELEGSVHNSENLARDEERLQWLRTTGIEILALQNDFVLSNPAEAHRHLKEAALNRARSNPHGPPLSA